MLVSSIQITLSTSSNIEAVNNEAYTCGSKAEIVCQIPDSKFGEITQAQWVKYAHSGYQVISHKQIQNGGGFLSLSLPLIYGNGKYSCQYDNQKLVSSTTYALNVTINFKGSSGSCSKSSATPTSTTPTSTTTTSTTTTSTSPSPTAGSTIGAHFAGLNPLIYTVISAVLLGILVLVSIITCWVRSRKNARLRALLPQETPQDYLDYIQQGQFTPLTTSEFIASLRERPPTYNESEVIQQQLSEDVTTDDSSPPPPLPPRNSSVGGSPVEEEGSNATREPLGNLNTSEGVVDHPASIPNLFPDDITLSFLLHESDTLQQTRPSIIEDNLDEDDFDSSETTNLMVGVVPSINNAVV